MFPAALCTGHTRLRMKRGTACRSLARRCRIYPSRLKKIARPGTECTRLHRDLVGILRDHRLHTVSGLRQVGGSLNMMVGIRCGSGNQWTERIAAVAPGGHSFADAAPSRLVYVPLDVTVHAAKLVPPMSGLNVPAAANTQHADEARESEGCPHQARLQADGALCTPVCGWARTADARCAAHTAFLAVVAAQARPIAFAALLAQRLSEPPSSTRDRNSGAKRTRVAPTADLAACFRRQACGVGGRASRARARGQRASRTVSSSWALLGMRGPLLAKAARRAACRKRGVRQAMNQSGSAQG